MAKKNVIFDKSEENENIACCATIRLPLDLIFSVEKESLLCNPHFAKKEEEATSTNL
jgi:hypothetical protein